MPSSRRYSSSSSSSSLTALAASLSKEIKEGQWIVARIVGAQRDYDAAQAVFGAFGSHTISNLPGIFVTSKNFASVSDKRVRILLPKDRFGIPRYANDKVLRESEFIAVYGISNQVLVEKRTSGGGGGEPILIATDVSSGRASKSIVRFIKLLSNELASVNKKQQNTVAYAKWKKKGAVVMGDWELIPKYQRDYENMNDMITKILIAIEDTAQLLGLYFDWKSFVGRRFLKDSPNLLFNDDDRKDILDNVIDKMWVISPDSRSWKVDALTWDTEEGDTKLRRMEFLAGSREVENLKLLGAYRFEFNTIGISGGATQLPVIVISEPTLRLLIEIAQDLDKRTKLDDMPKCFSIAAAAKEKAARAKTLLTGDVSEEDIGRAAADVASAFSNMRNADGCNYSLDMSTQDEMIVKLREAIAKQELQEDAPGSTKQKVVGKVEEVLASEGNKLLSVVRLEIGVDSLSIEFERYSKLDLLDERGIKMIGKIAPDANTGTFDLLDLPRRFKNAFLTGLRNMAVAQPEGADILYLLILDENARAIAKIFINGIEKMLQKARI